ncbi:MAG: hypothetical protein U0744_19075 [Gemmataceae bacterium]
MTKQPFRQSQPQKPRALGNPSVNITHINDVAIATSQQLVSGESRLNVRVTAQNVGTHLVLAKFYPSGSTADPADFKPENRRASWLRLRGGNVFEGSVPLATLGMANYVANLLVAVIYDTTKPDEFVDDSSFELEVKIPDPATTPVTSVVDARNSMWFAFAGYQFTATSAFAEDDATPAPDNPYRSAYRPHMLLVPQGASQCQVTLTPTDWTHLKTNAAASGPPSGIATSMKLNTAETANYQASVLGSDKIGDADLHLDALLYMWTDDSNGSNANQFQPLIDYTATPSSAPITKTLTKPAGATRLYFAMHDGQQWTDNDLTQTLTVTWS